MQNAVLLAEPEPTTRGFLERHLRQDGFVVVEAEDGEALDLVERRQPDVVLVSDALALELCRRLRQGEPGRSWDRELPVIVLGGQESDAVDRVRAFARGRDDFVPRPFHYDELVARIRAVLRRVAPPGRVLSAGAIEVDTATRRVTAAGDGSCCPARSTSCSSSWRATLRACSRRRSCYARCGLPLLGQRTAYVPRLRGRSEAGRVKPDLPPNIKLGQVRRTVGIVSADEWSSVTRDERDAVDALALHVWWRCRPRRNPALEGEDCVFLTVEHMQRLLRAIGARKTGEKAAATALKTMQARGWVEDTGTTKKPHRPERSRPGELRGQGGTRSRAGSGPIGGESSGFQCSARLSRRRGRCRARMHNSRRFRNA